MKRLKIWPVLQTALVRLKTDRRALAAVAVGVLLLVGVFLYDGTKGKAAKTQTDAQPSFSEAEVQSQLTALISNIRGAGKTEVMLTFESGSETVYAADTNAAFDRKDSGESDTLKSDVVLVKNGTQESGLRVKEIYPKVRGVAVVCEGGANAVIKEQIISLVTALFDIKSTNVSVAEMAAKEESS